MDLTISSAREYEGKNGTKSIIFNILLSIDEETKVSIKGFRYINGAIWFPSVKTKGGYTQNVHFTNNIYLGIYELIKDEEWARGLKKVDGAMVGDFLNTKTMQLGGFD